MENRIEATPRGARSGHWQYPDLSQDRQDDGHPHPVQSRDGRQAALHDGSEVRLGVALGWLSVGLGLAGLLAPRAMARAAGMPEWPMVMRMMGVRELVSGIGLLKQPDNQVWRWSRVAGDAMDMGIVGVAAASPHADRRRLAITAMSLASIGAVDLRAGNPPRITPSSQALAGPESGQRVQCAVSINRPPEECYRFWRDLERLPTFMQHLESVTATDERRSHWVARAPAGRTVEWDAEITEDQPGQLLGWRSVEGADVDNAGTIRFTPASKGGTVVQVQLTYQPPAGRAGAMVAKLFGEEPSIQVQQDLRRFKQLIETEEISTTHGQPAGKRSLKSMLMRKKIEN